MSSIAKDPRFPAYVWEAPVRVWHWTMALALVVLAVTGFLVGSPPAAGPGEASENFIFGYVRFAHFAAGYVFTALLVYRVAWAFMGNKHSREIFLVPVRVLTPAFWRETTGVLKHYLFLVRDDQAEHHVGHNPLAMTAMFAMYLLGSLFMIVTGFSLYGEGLGMQSWAYGWFTSWVNPLFGQSQDVHTWHRLGMWYLIWFTMVHMYFATREDLTSGLTVIGSMVNGWRRPKGPR
jgi:Ni/Fe-hydrogenase 1 B-type cytochrome subunit